MKLNGGTIKVPSLFSSCHLTLILHLVAGALVSGAAGVYQCHTTQPCEKLRGWYHVNVSIVFCSRQKCMPLIVHVKYWTNLSLFLHIQTSSNECMYEQKVFSMKHFSICFLSVWKFVSYDLCFYLFI